MARLRVTSSQDNGGELRGGATYGQPRAVARIAVVGELVQVEGHVWECYIDECYTLLRSVWLVLPAPVGVSSSAGSARTCL